jgi:sulfite reductase beta subunit-like hemoprotein
LNSGQFHASQLVTVLERAYFSGNIRVTPWRALYLPNCDLFDVAPYQIDEDKFFDGVNF